MSNITILPITTLSVMNTRKIKHQQPTMGKLTAIRFALILVNLIGVLLLIIILYSSVSGNGGEYIMIQKNFSRLASDDHQTTITVEQTQVVGGSRSAAVVPRKVTSRITKDFYPSANHIKEIMIAEQKQQQLLLLGNSAGAADTNNQQLSQSTMDTIEDFSNFYELTYAFISAFQRHNVSILAGAGSHLGARRHHAIIPFGEKDVDFEVFSLNETHVLSIINETLQSKQSWSTISVIISDFGYQLGHTTMQEHGYSHYIDFWLFDDGYEGNKIKCTGRVVEDDSPTYDYGEEFEEQRATTTTTTGCDKWYSHYNARPPPTFERSKHLPPAYQVFGTHKVPIPRTSAELETWEYAGDTEDWNTTCGLHQRWDDKLSTYVLVPREERDCGILFYDKYPFVFKRDDGTEELRQGNIVIHESQIEMK